LAVDGEVVHIVDDDDAVRDSVSFLLAAAKIRAVAHDSAVAFLKALPKLDVSCVVTDIRMPEMTGMDLLRHLRDKGFSVPVIMITGHGDVPLAVEAMKLGATDFIEKPFDDERLLSAIRAALDQRVSADAEQAHVAEVRARIESLSERERQVLDGLFAGQANKAIAYELGISARTVEVYRANVMGKMQAASLSDLVRMALLAGVHPAGPAGS
jgi:two-component system response regulator FixJ